MGSISHKAIHLMDPDIPVTLVKDGYGVGPGRRAVTAAATAHAAAR
jgi:hypothetical protein